MQFFTQLLGEQAFIGFVQLMFGKFLKSKPGFSNVYIPVLNFLVAVSGFAILPASAHAAAFFPVNEAISIALLGFLQTQSVVGTHSMFKNTVIPIAKQLAVWASARVLNAFAGPSEPSPPSTPYPVASSQRP